MIIIAYDQSVRTLMNNAGYDNSKIGYDSGSGSVTYGGQNFMKPQMNVNGTTYTDQTNFNNADNQFRNQYPDLHPSSQQQNNTYYTSSAGTGQQSAGNPNSAYATSNTTSAPNVTGAPGVNDLVNQIYQRVTNPQQFDVYNSPQFKAAQDQANYEAGLATRQAQEALGGSGFGRSTNLADRAQMIQDQANQRLMTQVVPQIIQQQRDYQNQQNQTLAGLVSPLIQQQQNQFNRGIEQAGLTGNYNGQQTLAAQNQAFNQGIQQAGLTGVYNPYASQIQQMQNNSAAWFNASPEQRAQLAAQNQQIGAAIGAKQDANGNWIFPQGQKTLAGEQQQAALTGLQANGSPTYAAQQQSIQNAIARANAFGQITNQEDAQLLGVPLGTTTRQLQALLYKNQYQNALLGLKSQANDIAAVRAGNQATRDQAMAGYYGARAGDVKNTQQANDITSEVYNHAQDFQTPQDVEDYFKANGSYLAQHLGAKATNDLKISFLQPFNQDNKQSTAQYDRALSAAQRDPRWLMPGADKNSLIKKYQQYYDNQP